MVSGYLILVKEERHEEAMAFLGSLPEVQTLSWFLQENPEWVNDTPFWVEERDSDDGGAGFLPTLYHLVSGLDAPHSWTQLLELVPTECRVGGIQPTIPSKLTFANFDEAAWVGDALLALTVRTTCLEKFGKIDGHWYQAHTSNDSMLKFLSKTAWILGDELKRRDASTWLQGQVFEFLFATDMQFRAQVLHVWKLTCPTDYYVEAVPVADSTPDIGTMTGLHSSYNHYCWRILFAIKPTLEQPWLRQPFLSKAQLLVLRRSTVCRRNGGHGWCATDFIDVNPAFARAMDDAHGAAKGTLRVQTSCWNGICGVFGCEPVLQGPAASSQLYTMFERPGFLGDKMSCELFIKCLDLNRIYPFTYVEWYPGDICHVQRATWSRETDNQWLASLSETLGNSILNPTRDEGQRPIRGNNLCGETFAVLACYCGDMRPTIELVYSMFNKTRLGRFAEPTPVEQQYSFVRPRAGWCASEATRVSPVCARHLFDVRGLRVGAVPTSYMATQDSTYCWGGEPISLTQDLHQKLTEQTYELDSWLDVQERFQVLHEWRLPDDLLLVTHTDHIDHNRLEGVATYELDVTSKDFIRLRQDILQGGVFALYDMYLLQKQLLAALKVAMPIFEQSDLFYLLSGTTFHYFVGSLFRDKQVYEICPVPREDNGVCPEFYLGHYASFFSSNPRFGHEIGRVYNQWLSAPMYLKELEWEGEYVYHEPPKFHSVMPWAQERWKLESPNIGFKPYDDILRKRFFKERKRIKPYCSLCSCENLPPNIMEAISWLWGLYVDWYLDPRWKHVFEGCKIIGSGYFPHSTGLASFDWVIHHGGSGTTNTCLAVGVQQTILPIIGDQFIWAESLYEHTVKPFTEEAIIRALLYRDRLPASIRYTPPPFLLSGPSEFADEIQRNGLDPIRTFWICLHCCHDWDPYGWKPTRLIVGQTKDLWFTLFDTVLQRTGKSGVPQLKWMTKECMITAPPVRGWRGTNVNATYPFHAHGWLGSFCRECGYRFIVLDIPVDWLLWLARQSLTAKDKRLKRRSQRPSSGECKRCHRTREICSRCVRFIVAHSVATGEIPDLPPFLKWSGNKLKGPSKSKAVGLQLSGSAIRSQRRYLQLDTRAIEQSSGAASCEGIARQNNYFSDTKWVEAFWWYTKTIPPHYKLKTPEKAVQEMISVQAALHAEVAVGGIAQDVVRALGSVLSVSNPRSLARRLIGLNVLTAPGRGIMRTKWHVLVDALRHFSDMAEALNITVMPSIVKSTFPKIEDASCVSYVHYKRGLASPIRSRPHTHAWLQTLGSVEGCIKIHFFSLKLPAFGPRFGVFHAVVEYAGKFYELQQVSGNFTRINISKWQPEATVDRPLVKTVVISEKVVGAWPEKNIIREFSDNDYKVLGDNCLVFCQFCCLLCSNLLGKVVPWKHFGIFGEDLSLQLGTHLRKWAVSHLWTDPDERRVSLTGLKFHLEGRVKPFTSVARPRLVAGPRRKIQDYGLHALWTVDKVIEDFDRDLPDDTPWSKDALLDLALLGYKKFGLSSHLVSQALLWCRMSSIPQRRRRVNLLSALQSMLRKLPSTRLAQDVVHVLESTSRLWMPLRTTKKPAWAPLLYITVPRHWFREKDRLLEHNHQAENLTVGSKHILRLHLPQIQKRYEHYFPNVQFPKMGFKYVRPGEYEIRVKVPLRKNLPRMDEFTAKLVEELQEMHPFEMGVFSLRFGTEEMAEKVSDRYFTGTFEAGQFIPEQDQQDLADAIFRNERHLYENAQLLYPEEVWKKWHKKYSAGFPFRFNIKGNAKRQALFDAAGGKQKFLQGIRDYIPSPESFPTVSHAFIKDEVLPGSYIEREKIRTIIAQDPLNYFAEMAVQGDHGKRLHPSSFSAVGVSPAHGELSALAEKHLAYKHHFAMDVTALDSTAAVDAIQTIKKLRFLGFQNHPQADKIKTFIDGVLSNLQTSWIFDIHTGRARLKRQGFTTGHGVTTGNNTEYMVMLLLRMEKDAWHKVSGRSYDEFYEQVKFSSFSDDNFWSTNLPRSVFSAEKISKFWLQRGVQVRVEGDSDDLSTSKISFLAKQLSLDPKHLEEAQKYNHHRSKSTGRRCPCLNRLLQKFSDFKKKNTITYRWEKLVALQANCAHHKDVFCKASEYLDALEREMSRRKFTLRFMKQHPRKTYPEIMRLMYAPGKHENKMIVSSLDDKWTHSLLLWWDTIRVDIMAFDGTANSYARVLNQFSGLLELGGLSVEDPGVFLKQPGELPTDPEFTLEHHCWLLNGCPQSFEVFRSLLQKTPFSSFCDTEGFWARRERFDISEEAANGLRAKVLLLQGVYTIVAWLVNPITCIPSYWSYLQGILFCYGMSENMYSRLYALYYAMFGDSSLVLSSLLPKDRYISLYVLAFKVWVKFTSTDNLDFAGDLDQFKGLADSAAKLAQDVHNLLFEFDISSVVPRPDTGESTNTGLTRKWEALDHTASVRQCVDLIEGGETPIVTGPTGCGKSTDFIVNLHDHYNTVLVAAPRRVLVRNSPVAQKRLYSGSEDKLTPGLINFGTSGYFRRVLGEIPEPTILVLDEFHELDEDALWLEANFKGHVIVVSATPEFPNSSKFTPVHLTKSRNSGHVVTSLVKSTKGKIEDIWDELTMSGNIDKKVLVIVPTVRMVQDLSRHALKLAPGKRVCELFRGHDTVSPDADWYLATSIVDAGLTISGVNKVIDSGWSSGWSNGHFVTRPSSHNVADQRRGRTGRDCDGFYIRLQGAYHDEPWDFTTPFLFNSWSVAKQWSKLKRPAVMGRGCLESLPTGYDALLAEKDWSSLIYIVFYYQNRGVLIMTRADYQSARKFPVMQDLQFTMGPVVNRRFVLHLVEARLSLYRMPFGEGNVWDWSGQKVFVQDFSDPIPKHLQDFDL